MEFWDNVRRGLQIAANAIENYERGQQIANLIIGDQGTMGTLQYSGEVDLYTIFLPTRGEYTFQLTQPVFTDFDLFVFDARGVLVESDTSQDNPSVVQVTGRGQCFVAVKSVRGIGRYSLSVRRC